MLKKCQTVVKFLKNNINFNIRTLFYQVQVKNKNKSRQVDLQQQSLPRISQENVAISELEVSENNDSAQKVNISTENHTSIDNYKFVCLFCNR